MTLPIERTRSVVWAGAFLTAILREKIKVSKKNREMIKTILRHYPSPSEVWNMENCRLEYSDWKNQVSVNTARVYLLGEEDELGLTIDQVKAGFKEALRSSKKNYTFKQMCSDFYKWINGQTCPVLSSGEGGFYRHDVQRFIEMKLRNKPTYWD